MRRRSEVGTRSAPAGKRFINADQQANESNPAPPTRANGARPRAPREFPIGALLRNQTLATATGGLLVALLIADRLVLWKRPRWLLRLPDEGVQIPIFGEMVLPLGSRLFRSLKYRPRVLDAGGGATGPDCATLRCHRHGGAAPPPPEPAGEALPNNTNHQTQP